MNTKLILKYLSNIAANNSREWFLEHKAEYERARKDFESGVEELILALTGIDETVKHLKVKDCVYRFYRDVRFSNDKSPYKRHFGAYISAKGKKSLHGGYYIHLQPGNCFIATGSYWLPTNILTSCRNEIMANIDEWQSCVANGQFIHLYGYPGQSNMEDYTDEDKMSEKGFGISHLKKAPKDFPKDYEHLDYLKMKDYCCWHTVSDDFFSRKDWTAEAIKMFDVAKPMMDFINAVIDDYE